MRIKAWWLWISFITGFLCAMWAEELYVHRQGEDLHISAPRFHFLTGNSLARLQDGASVPFEFQLSLWTDSRNRLLQRARDLFVVSYDVWEEKFSVAKLQSARKSASHLTASAAEAWCMENISVSTAGIAADQQLWLKLDIRAADAKNQPPIFGDSGISVTGIIELFSRPAQTTQSSWTLNAGPFRLSEVKSGNGRGS